MQPDLRTDFESLLVHPRLAPLRRTAGAFSCHLVGGAVRDFAWRRDLVDFDFTVAANGDAFAEAIAMATKGKLIQLGGTRFAAYRIVSEGSVFDVWDREGETLLADLKRRDLTINAIAVDLANGIVVDPTGGVADLRVGKLRAVRDDSFVADPLRVIRLARIGAADSWLTVEPYTLQLAQAAADLMPNVSVERIRDELARLFREAPVPGGMAALLELSLYPTLWHKETDVTVDRQTIELLGQRVQGLFEELRSTLSDLPGTLRKARACHGALLAYLAGRTSRSPATLAEEARTSRILTATESRFIAAATTDRGQTATPAEFLAEWQDAWPTAWVLGEISALLEQGPAPPPPLTGLVSYLQQHGAAAFTPQPLLNGHEIGALLHLRPGREVGVARQALLRAQLRGEIRDRSTAERYLVERFERQNNG